MNSKRRRPHGKKHSVAETVGKGLGDDTQKIQKITKRAKAEAKRITAREIGRQAAYKQLVSDELCRDLAFSFARESARRTGHLIGDVRDRYETIAIELLAERYTQTDGTRYSLGTVLRGKYESDSALKEFLPKFAKWIDEYVSDCIREHSFGFTPLYRQIVPSHTWSWCDHCVSRELLTAFAEEYVRDREGLMRFLLACFTRWRKIYEHDSLWRVRLVTQQIAARYGHDRKRILEYLQKIGVISCDLTSANLRSQLSKIGQDLSRGQRTAIGKDILIALRAAGERGITERQLSWQIFKRNVSSDALSNVLGFLRRSGQAKCEWEKADGGRRKRWFAKKQQIKSKKKPR